MLRGSTPIQLRQLDMSPALQAGALEQQAIVDMYSGIQQGIQNFQEKQEKKQQNEMTVNALKQFVPGLGDDVYKAISKDPQILKSMGDIANIQQVRQEQEILTQGMQDIEDQKRIAEQAIGLNTTTEGTIDMSGVKESFIELGGRNLEVFGGLLDVPGEVKISPEGLVTQDGKLFTQLPQSALGIPPTEDQKKETALRLEILEAERDILLKQLGEGVNDEYGIDVSLLSDDDLEAYNQAMANPESEGAQKLFSFLLEDQQANQ